MIVIMYWNGEHLEPTNRNIIYNSITAGEEELSVKVWRAIRFSHKSTLIHMIPLNIANIFNPVAIPFGLASFGQGFIVKDDNGRLHAARIVRDFHEQNLNYTNAIFQNTEI